MQAERRPGGAAGPAGRPQDGAGQATAARAQSSAPRSTGQPLRRSTSTTQATAGTTNAGYASRLSTRAPGQASGNPAQAPAPGSRTLNSSRSLPQPAQSRAASTSTDLHSTPSEGLQRAPSGADRPLPGSQPRARFSNTSTLAQRASSLASNASQTRTSALTQESSRPLLRSQSSNAPAARAGTGPAGSQAQQPDFTILSSEPRTVATAGTHLGSREGSAGTQVPSLATEARFGATVGAGTIVRGGQGLSSSGTATQQQQPAARPSMIAATVSPVAPASQLTVAAAAAARTATQVPAVTRTPTSTSSTSTAPTASDTVSRVSASLGIDTRRHASEATAQLSAGAGVGSGPGVIATTWDAGPRTHAPQAADASLIFGMSSTQHDTPHAPRMGPTWGAGASAAHGSTVSAVRRMLESPASSSNTSMGTPNRADSSAGASTSAGNSRATTSGSQRPRLLGQRFVGVESDSSSSSAPEIPMFGLTQRGTGGVAASVPNASPSGVTMPGSAAYMEQFRNRMAARDEERQRLMDRLRTSHEELLRQAEDLQLAMALSMSLQETPRSRALEDTTSSMFPGLANALSGPPTTSVTERSPPAMERPPLASPSDTTATTTTTSTRDTLSTSTATSRRETREDTVPGLDPVAAAILRAGGRPPAGRLVEHLLTSGLFGGPGGQPRLTHGTGDEDGTGRGFESLGGRPRLTAENAGGAGRAPEGALAAARLIMQSLRGGEGGAGGDERAGEGEGESQTGRPNGGRGAVIIHSAAPGGGGTWLLGIPGPNGGFQAIRLPFDGGLDDDLSYERLVQLEDVKVPTPQAVLDALPETPYLRRSEGGEGLHQRIFLDGSCPICMEDYETRDPISHLPCRHGFHTGCVKKWLGQSKLCPVCKASVV